MKTGQINYLEQQLMDLKKKMHQLIDGPNFDMNELTRFANELTTLQNQVVDQNQQQSSYASVHKLDLSKIKKGVGWSQG